jgi:hypothetical protein
MMRKKKKEIAFVAIKILLKELYSLDLIDFGKLI